MDFGVSDVDSVEEGEEEKDEKGRHDMAVNFPEEFLLCDGIDRFIESDFLDVVGMRNFLFLIPREAGRMNWAVHLEGPGIQFRRN